MYAKKSLAFMLEAFVVKNKIKYITKVLQVFANR